MGNCLRRGALRFSLLTVVTLAITLSRHSATAQDLQQPDETLPGFKSQQVYDFHGIDSVNIFSGALNLAIPLGPEYPLSSGLKWRLTGHYSSKMWHMEQDACAGENLSCPGTPLYAKQAQVAGYSTIGVGWTLELGSVRPQTGTQPATYKAPDGSVHFSAADSFLDANFRLVLKNGTYIVRQVDGTILYFEHPYTIPTPVNGFDFSDEDRRNNDTYQSLRYGLSKIVDRFNRTVLQVTYRGDYPWQVDSVQLLNPARTITYHWKTYPVTGPGGQAWSFDVLDWIDFPASVSGGSTLRAGFQYLPGGSLTRSGFDSGGPANCVTTYQDTYGTSQASLPLLASITQSAPPPGDLVATQTFSFAYDGGGYLSTLTLPTGGTVAYEYGGIGAGEPNLCHTPCVSPETKAGSCFNPSSLTLGLPAPGTVNSPNPGDRCSDWKHRSDFIDQSPAVTKRTESGLPGELAAIVTSYTRSVEASPYPYPDETVVDIAKIVRLVFVQKADGNGGPLTTKHVFSDGGSAGAELSRRYYTNCDGRDGPLQPVRSVVQCFRRSNVDPQARLCGVMGTDTFINNMDPLDLVPSRQETWYGANPIPDTGGCTNPATSVPCWQDEFSAYNPNALEYGTVTRSSNSSILFSPQGAARVTTTGWVCPATGPPLPPQCDPLGTGSWLPKLFSSKTVSDTPCLNAPCTVTTNYSFDTDNGFLKNWVTDGNTYGTLTHSFLDDFGGEAHDADWNPTSLKVSGTGGVDTRVFQTTRVFTPGTGLLKSAQQQGVSWKSFDVDRDTNTALIATSRDPNGLSTTYEYDPLSRLKAIKPPAGGGELSTTYCYSDWVSSKPTDRAYVLVKRGGDVCSLDDGAPGIGSGGFEAYQYDGLGRLVRQAKRLPNALPGTGSVFSFKETRYNEAGLTSFESEWVPCAATYGPNSVKGCFSSAALTPNATRYSAFDFLGRAKTVVAPDGFVTTRSFDDPEGVSNSDFSEIDTFNVGGQSVTGGSRKDILGRTLRVWEPNPGGIGPYSGYSYNVLDKVANVNVNQSAGGGQTRTFTYDAFGLLRSEIQPETGTTTYSSYDARGKVLTWTAGDPPDTKTYTATYDAAGRQTLLQVGTTTYQQSLFDVAAPGPPCLYCLGRLSQRIGSNAGANPAYSVTENFVYSDPTGRLSQKTTTVGSSPSLTVTEKWLYNSLGLVQNYFHPRAGGTPFVVSTGYVSGQAVLVTANGIPVVTSATYHPYGGLASYSTGDATSHDVMTTIAADPNLMPRPGQISTSGANSSFNTGAFSYDGAGNVLAMGSDTFGYDSRSRLTSANLNGVGSQGYQYDAFGNLYRRTDTNLFWWTANARNQFNEYVYDPLGNLTNPPGETITYDPLSQATSSTVPGDTWHYYYTGAGERVLKTSAAAGNTFTFRDADNRMATEYVPYNGSPIPSRDNVFLGHLLVGSYADVRVAGNDPTNPWIYYSSDHLGTPRLLTNVMGTTLETRRSWPFGEDATTQPPSPQQRLRFSTMERDPEGQRYYDHARSHSFGLARFMSPDKLGGKVDEPQSWNRYTYSRNNPLKYLDPDGNSVQLADFVSQQTLDRNSTIRSYISTVGAVVGAISGISGLGRFADRAAAGLFPQTYQEVGANVQASVAGMVAGVSVPGSVVTNAAYRSINAIGEVQYAGITNDLARRAAQHLGEKGIAIEPVLAGLSRPDARAVEQALIEIHGLEKNGGTLINKINSISNKNPEYGAQLQRGYDLLKTAGYDAPF